MSDDDSKKVGAPSEEPVPELPPEEASARPDDRRISDFVRRAVSAGVGAARNSKEDIMRAAANEVRSWLEHLNMNDEVAKVLAKMVIEVKTEIRFRPTDDGKVVSETTNEVKVKPPA